MLFVDATTAEHTQGIRTVVLGIVGALSESQEESAMAAVGPRLESAFQLPTRHVALARTRPGRIVYQRLLLPFDAFSVGRHGDPVDRVLMLDAYAPLLRPPGKTRYAALVHDLLPLSHPQYWPFAKRLVKRTAVGSLRRAHATLFTSTEFNARNIERLLDTSPRVVRFGCGQLADHEADAALEAPLPQRQPYLLFVGAFEPRKSPMTLIDIFELVAPERTDLRLILAGDGADTYVDAIRARIGKASDPDRIEVVRRPRREDLLALVARASALVMPTRAEGFGLPLLEAVALGTPVVTSDLPSVRSWAGETVRYAAPDRPPEWVEPVLEAITSSEGWRRSGQRSVRNYRWSHCAQELVRF